VWENGRRERWADEYMTESADDPEKVDMADMV
jgi:hypothetical protein